MIYHANHIESVVRDELIKACAANGISKDEAGFAIGGFGALMPVVMNGATGIAPAWSLLISLRHRLLGHGPVGASVPVPGVLPPDEVFRKTVKELLPKVIEQRELEFRDGGPGNGQANPFEVRPA